MSEVQLASASEKQVARIGERQEFLIEQLRDLNASLRWMRAADEPSGRRQRTRDPSA